MKYLQPSSHGGRNGGGVGIDVGTGGSVVGYDDVGGDVVVDVHTHVACNLFNSVLMFSLSFLNFNHSLIQSLDC